jgi:hypothetical protein
VFLDRAAKALNVFTHYLVRSRTQRTQQLRAAPPTGQRVDMRSEHEQRTQRDRTNGEENPQRDHDRGISFKEIRSYLCGKKFA